MWKHVRVLHRRMSHEYSEYPDCGQAGPHDMNPPRTGGANDPGKDGKIDCCQEPDAIDNQYFGKGRGGIDNAQAWLLQAQPGVMRHDDASAHGKD